jgi:hypothetical protein
MRRDAMKVRRIAGLALLALLAASPAGALYNANMEGVLAWVSTYSDGDYIYFRMVNQPTTHPACNPGYFVLPETIPAERLNRMLARLLTAYAAGETVNVGYDATGDCVHGYIRAHRVG